MCVREKPFTQATSDLADTLRRGHPPRLKLGDEGGSGHSSS